jgi:hypothetical protein
VASTTARPLRGRELREPLLDDAALARYQRAIAPTPSSTRSSSGACGAALMDF